MLRKLLRWARVTGVAPPGQQFASQQLSYLGKTADSAMLFPFGFYANLPPDVLALIGSVQGNPDNRVVLGTLLKERPDLESGEVAFYHPASGNLIKWMQNGDLVIDNGESTMVLSGDTLTINANVVINGNVSTVGTVTNNGDNIGNTHGHTQGNDSGGNSEAAISGVT